MCLSSHHSAIPLNANLLPQQLPQHVQHLPFIDDFPRPTDQQQPRIKSVTCPRDSLQQQHNYFLMAKNENSTFQMVNCSASNILAVDPLGQLKETTANQCQDRVYFVGSDVNGNNFLDIINNNVVNNINVTNNNPQREQVQNSTRQAKPKLPGKMKASAIQNKAIQKLQTQPLKHLPTLLPNLSNCQPPQQQQQQQQQSQQQSVRSSQQLLSASQSCNYSVMPGTALVVVPNVIAIGDTLLLCLPHLQQ